MKIFDKKDVFSVLNAEEASEYVGTKGYFAYTLSALKEKVQKNILSTLEDIKQLTDYPFITHGSEYGLFFLPADKVKEVEEKKYSPFKAMFEFVNTVGKRTGDTIRIRAKKDNPLESIYLITGYTETHAHELKYIHLSAISYPPQELLKNYEYFADGTWQPFGILENEE